MQLRDSQGLTLTFLISHYQYSKQTKLENQKHWWEQDVVKPQQNIAQLQKDKRCVYSKRAVPNNNNNTRAASELFVHSPFYQIIGFYIYVYVLVSVFNVFMSLDLIYMHTNIKESKNVLKINVFYQCVVFEMSYSQKCGRE